MVDLVALPPAEAIEYFRQKGFAVGFDYRDVWQAQHQSAFTVAKAMQLDLLQDIRAEVDRALAEGTTLQDFQKRLMPTLQAKGWWGRQDRLDPLTGEVRDVQLGSPRRLKVIYDTNLRTAHSEGQWQRIQDRKAAFPYLQYDGGNSENPRLQHSAWDGLVLSVDDPFWQSHMPVKEWGCKCRVIPMTAGQLQRQGIEVSESPKVPSVPFVNKRTGEVQQIPKGVHPAFHYPPGGRRASLSQHLVDKVAAAPAALARASIADLVTGQAFAEWHRKPAGSFPVGLLGQNVADRVGAKTSVVTLTEAVLAEQLANQPTILVEDYALVQMIVDRAIPNLQADGSLLYVVEQADGSILQLTIHQAESEVVVRSLARMFR
ncbi:phage minor head protein [Pseudomonas sp. Q2-TVG4-2]|uniref:phage head morphogenesis protein n=1 Tax=Pseudomonas sp. Q2-TVG4-2 TaxID=1685699 RepID=UPI0015E65D87|nr:phage minor head protein [Pseudomonas sp. Q2-TVG4-2]